jgi:hypothetical protein
MEEIVEVALVFSIIEATAVFVDLVTFTTADQVENIRRLGRTLWGCQLTCLSQSFGSSSPFASHDIPPTPSIRSMFLSSTNPLRSVVRLPL